MIGVWIRIGPSAKRLNALSEKSTGWRQLPLGGKTHEVTTNVYLALLNGHTLRLPAHLAKTRAGRIALWVTETVTENLRKQYRTQACRWKEQWQDCLDGFFAILARCECDLVSFAESTGNLSAMLQSPLPSDLLDLSLCVPFAFSRLVMTYFDVLALGRQFLAQYPDRSHPVLLLGCVRPAPIFLHCCAPYLPGKIIPLSPGLHQLRRGLQFPGR